MKRKEKIIYNGLTIYLEIMLTYNNKDVHSATGQTPNEARKKKNEYKSVLNVSVKAKKERNVS